MGRSPALEALAGVSASLTAWLDSDERARAAFEEGIPPDPKSYRADAQMMVETEGLDGLRWFKRVRLAQIAATDAAGDLDLARIGDGLAELADACLEAALSAVDPDRSLGIIAMGKLGGRELNYYSDIDVMFVSDRDPQHAARAASRLLSELGGSSPAGQAYLIDANLRPEGRSGALVRSLEGFLEYYKRWAKPWEFQALLKARACAGDVALAQKLVDATRALVFPLEVTEERVAETRRMKERVETHASQTARRAHSSKNDDVKLGPGGIRDIEFSVQLFQLVHGGNDDTVRPPSTLAALSALVDGGYIAEDDGAGLAVAYRWLRNVEHRLQLWNERRVRTLPANPDDRARLARGLGFKDTPSRGAAGRFDDAHRAVLTDVRARFDKLFYRPMIETLGEAQPRLPEAALAARLGILGFRDVTRAARTLEGLVSGSSRRAKLFRVLTPALLKWLSVTPSPDEGLFSFLRLGEALESRVDVMGTLRDNPPGIRLLASVLGSGRVLGDLLVQVPDEIAQIASSEGVFEPKDRDRYVREASSSLNWRSPETRLDGLRRFKRREALRISVADIAGATSFADVGTSLTHLAEACLEAGLEGVDMPFAVVGMGKLGGRELSISSDIDVVFVHDGDPGRAEKIAEELLRAIGEVTREGQAFRIDASLRPEGKAGALVRSLDAYLEYYDRWAKPWEHLALIKARAAAGDIELGQALVAATRRWAYPEHDDPAAVAEIRHLKARMEKERIPKGTEPRRNLKLGPGGLSDVEFAAQMLQRAHGAEHESLRGTGTTEALTAAGEIGLIAPFDAERLRDAYAWLGTMRNRLFLLTARPDDSLPVKQELLEALGISMGFTGQPRQELEETFLKTTRRVRRVTEELIFG